VIVNVGREDTGSPVTGAYKSANTYAGEIEKVMISLM
jgi:hypothetical protein